MIKDLLAGKSGKQKAVIIVLLLLALSLVILINWIIYKLLGFIVGSLISFGIILSSYYLSVREAVRMLSFPGITTWMKRTLEFDFCKRTA
jgi:uncharacterized RDD family membrane protein YckC